MFVFRELGAYKTSLKSLSINSNGVRGSIKSVVRCNRDTLDFTLCHTHFLHFISDCYFSNGNDKFRIRHVQRLEVRGYDKNKGVNCLPYTIFFSSCNM